ncbi:invasion associated locus B family protein [Methylobacterium sp. 77]|uniref:invasion associated locus B family protein n=1 Tax=Methylobacterium sp. 77 TaxID=1101192 RepID=UPI000369C7F5|nr:invasion associated locus B family protein [Methylobacterium sp. 77]
MRWRHVLPLVGVLSLAATCHAWNGAAAQDAAPEQDAPAAPDAAPKPKPKPKPKPAPKPAAPVAAAPAAAPAKAAWPEGASALSETYGDWSINCSRENQATICSVVQAQGSKRENRREFAIELKAPANDRTDGLILMPFGFQIEPGLSFKIDEAVLGKGAPYYACSSEGCLVPVSLPTLATDAMKTAKNLFILALKQDATEPTTITVPLNGFGAALARASALSN